MAAIAIAAVFVRQITENCYGRAGALRRRVVPISPLSPSLSVLPTAAASLAAVVKIIMSEVDVINVVGVKFGIDKTICQ